MVSRSLFGYFLLLSLSFGATIELLFFEQSQLATAALIGLALGYSMKKYFTEISRLLEE